MGDQHDTLAHWLSLDLRTTRLTREWELFHRVEQMVAAYEERIEATGISPFRLVGGI